MAKVTIDRRLGKVFGANVNKMADIRAAIDADRAAKQREVDAGEALKVAAFKRAMKKRGRLR